MSEHENPQAAYDSANGLDLNLDLSSVDTSYPSLAVGKPAMTIIKLDISPWKSDPKNKSLVVQLQTTDIQPSTKGEDLPPGFKTNYRLNLQQGYNAAGEAVGDYKKDIARFLDAVFGTDSPRPRFNQETINACIGKTVKAVVKARKDTTDGYGDTEVKYLEAVK